MTTPMFRWLDPEDAIFVASARDALRIERQAWEGCHAERQRLHIENERLCAELTRLQSMFGDHK